MRQWDVIVIGLGGVGSSACFHLAKSGMSVLGIDQYSPGHGFGSSHGQTRIVRQAYFEGVGYVPLLKRSYELWDQLNQVVDKPLFVRCGLLQMGPPDGIVVPGVLRSASAHDLSVRAYSSDELKQAWPGICCESSHVGVFEANAGYVEVERAVVTQLQLAQSEGAELIHGARVTAYEERSDGVSVSVNDQTFHAGQLVLALGPWSSAWLGDLIGAKISVLRKHLYWFESQSEALRVDSGAPCFFHETSHGCFYGFPRIDPLGVKIAMHSGGALVRQPQVSDHDGVDRDSELEECLRYAGSCLPGVTQRLKNQQVCYYSMTPDEAFILGRLVDQSKLIVAAGLSGHGFKFTPVLGELISQIASHDNLRYDLTAFSPSRWRK